MDKFIVRLAPGEARPSAPPSADVLRGGPLRRARPFFAQALGVDPDNKPARRPTRREVELYGLVETLSQRFATDSVAATSGAAAVTLDDWWASQPEHGRFSAAVAADAAAEPAGGRRSFSGPWGFAIAAERAAHGYVNPSIRLVYQFCMHVWNRDGTHQAFRTVADFQRTVFVQTGHEGIPDSTAARWLAREKEAFSQGNAGKHRALLTRPDITRMMLDIEAVRRESKAAEEEPDRSGDRPPIFHPDWHDELLSRCRDLQDTPWFGTVVVRALAEDIYHRNAHMDAPPWSPSDTWCLWFVKKKLQLVQRRVTGHVPLAGDNAKTEELHRINLYKVALALQSGLPKKYFITLDETGERTRAARVLWYRTRSVSIHGCACSTSAVLCAGVHYFPQKTVVWAEKGAQHVNSILGEDKRQFTADFVANGAGDIVVVEAIFGGKTEASEPTPQVKRLHPIVMCNHSPNHWANHGTKTALLQHVWRWVLVQTAADLGKDVVDDEVRSAARCVVLMDCWPVNLTADMEAFVRENCPGMERLFVPAGSTSSKQVRLFMPFSDEPHCIGQSPH